MLMSKVILVLFIFLFYGFYGVFGSHGGTPCLYDFDGDGDLDDHSHIYTNHVCEKIGSTYCHLPKNPTLSPHYKSAPLQAGDTTLEEKFSSIYGGCSLSLSGGSLLTGLDGNEYIEFTKLCGVGGFEFRTNVNHRYLLYRKDGIVMVGAESEEKVLGTLTLNKEKFRDSVEGGGNFLERGIYTLRVRAEIKDDKCSGRPERDIYPINVFTNLDLDLKLNNAGRIVYDDEETQKIEIVPGQDRFTFQGTTFSRDDILKDSEGDEITLGQGKITIKESS